MFKKRIALFLSILFIFAFISPYSTIAGQDSDPVEEDHLRPMWKYIMTHSSTFDIERWGKAGTSSTITSFDADELSVEIRLQQYKNNQWVTIKTWSDRDVAPYCGTGGYWYVAKGYYYRTVAIGKAYVNGVVVEQSPIVSQTEQY